MINFVRNLLENLGGGPSGHVTGQRFETRAPSHQNAIDIFRGRWASNLTPIYEGSTAGQALHFHPEPRINHLVATLGKNDRIDNMKVLELGPLEAAHTWKLEQLGGNVLAIEANREAFLKCLIVKEITSMKSRFLCGDFLEHLRHCDHRYDIIVASGVLYHMSDPITLVELISRRTDRCFVWTHIYDENYNGPKRTLVRDTRFPEVELWAFDYGFTMNAPGFWGGNHSQAMWMRREDVLSLFSSYGFSTFRFLDSAPTTLCFSAWK